MKRTLRESVETAFNQFQIQLVPSNSTNQANLGKVHREFECHSLKIHRRRGSNLSADRGSPCSSDQLVRRSSSRTVMRLPSMSTTRSITWWVGAPPIASEYHSSTNGMAPYRAAGIKSSCVGSPSVKMRVSRMSFGSDETLVCACIRAPALNSSHALISRLFFIAVRGE